MNSEPPASLINATAEFLRKYPPFDHMEPGALRYLAGRLRLNYHPRDSVILSPDHGTPSSLRIIQRGLVQIHQSGSYAAAYGPTGSLGPGECFSVAALMEERPVSAPYVAVADTFCYELAKPDFTELLHRSPRALDFATNYLKSLLRESRRLLKMHYSSSTGEQQAMSRPLRSLIKRTLISCAPETSIGDALRAIHRANVGSIAIVSPQGMPLGILTRHDVVGRVTLPELDLNRPINSIMTPYPHTLPAEANAHDAALAMARHGIRHVLVMDEGRVIGVVTERDLFLLQQVSMRRINVTITGAASIDDLKQAADDIRHLIRLMLEQGVSAEQLTLIISTLNDALTQRIIELELQRHDLDDIEWCWLAFGSEGRYEQTLYTDQDNGLIFAEPDNGDSEAIRRRLLPMAKAVNHALDACGFPLCKGNIMAGNPELCLSLQEWRRKFSGWIGNPAPKALLNASIFFDFRPLLGATQLADTLREGLLALTATHAGFLHMMAQNALQVAPPLGHLRDFIVDEDGDFPGTINLKNSGARLFVDAARIFSLAQGVASTSTAQRLRTAGTRMNMSEDEVASSVESFYFIQQQRLRHQYGEVQCAPGGENRIDPDKLNEVDRRILKEALRQARKLQTRLELDYQL